LEIRELPFEFHPLEKVQVTAYSYGTFVKTPAKTGMVQGLRLCSWIGIVEVLFLPWKMEISTRSPSVP